jgi:hypothetical protein
MALSLKAAVAPPRNPPPVPFAVHCLNEHARSQFVPVLEPSRSNGERHALRHGRSQVPTARRFPCESHWSSLVFPTVVGTAARSLARTQGPAQDPRLPAICRGALSGDRESRRQSAISEQPPRSLAVGASQDHHWKEVAGVVVLLALNGPARSTPAASWTSRTRSSRGAATGMTSAGSPRCAGGCWS